MSLYILLTVSSYSYTIVPVMPEITGAQAAYVMASPIQTDPTQT